MNTVILTFTNDASAAMFFAWWRSAGYQALGAVIPTLESEDKEFSGTHTAQQGPESTDVESIVY